MKVHHCTTAATLVCCGLMTSALASLPALALEGNDPQETGHGSDHPVSDTWITTKVKSELATTEGVKSMDISVKTVNGVVTLTGTQRNQTAIERAVAAAQKAKGVQRVDEPA